MAASRSCLPLLVLLLVAAASSLQAEASFRHHHRHTHSTGGGLSPYYYYYKCHNVERVVRQAVFDGLSQNPGFAPGLIRLLFHDCFGNLKCDGSVLLDVTGTGDNTTEKDAIPNRSLRGFEVIDAAKEQLESICPGQVSCSDILTYAARDAVYATGGFWFPVSGGRRDGVDSPSTGLNLPPSLFKVDNLTATFAKAGLTQREMVTLSGAHTFGRSTTCFNFFNRIYNFSATSDVDPTLDPALAQQLQAACPRNGRFNPAIEPLDLVTPGKFDRQYYTNLVNRKGLFTSDQDLFEDPRTKAQVVTYAYSTRAFFKDFGAAFTRMASIGVLTGTQGEVRLNCRVPN